MKEACLLVLSFLVGAYACGLLIDKNQVHFLGKAFYGLALVLNSSLLVTAAFIPGRLLPVCLVAAACGLQNAMCTSHFGAIIRTTHVTGTVTDIGSTFGRISMIYLRKGCRRSKLNDVERAEVGVDARKLGVLFGLWSFYFMGGLFGVYMETWLHSGAGVCSCLVNCFELKASEHLLKPSGEHYPWTPSACLAPASHLHWKRRSFLHGMSPDLEGVTVLEPGERYVHSKLSQAFLANPSLAG